MLGWIIIPNQRRAKLNLLICRSCESMKFHLLPRFNRLKSIWMRKTRVKLNFSIKPARHQSGRHPSSDAAVWRYDIFKGSERTFCYYKFNEEREFLLDSIRRKMSSTSLVPLQLKKSQRHGTISFMVFLQTIKKRYFKFPTFQAYITYTFIERPGTKYFQFILKLSARYALHSALSIFLETLSASATLAERIH